MFQCDTVEQYSGNCLGMSISPVLGIFVTHVGSLFSVGMKDAYLFENESNMGAQQPALKRRKKRYPFIAAANDFVVLAKAFTEG